MVTGHSKECPFFMLFTDISHTRLQKFNEKIFKKTGMFLQVAAYNWVGGGKWKRNPKDNQ